MLRLIIGVMQKYFLILHVTIYLVINFHFNNYTILTVKLNKCYFIYTAYSMIIIFRSVFRLRILLMPAGLLLTLPLSYL